MMTLAARAMKLAGRLDGENSEAALVAFADVSSVASYAKSSVAALVREGIVEGDGGSIHLLGQATRAETAVMMYRIYGN
ncbi:Endo-1,4-beta-xylanase A precursor [compost metagenome]